MILIERLEALSGPCRECDEAIADALFERSQFAQLADAPIPTGCQMWWQDGQECSALRYTHSIDAAMTLTKGWEMWLELKGPRKYLTIPTPVPNYWSANLESWNHETQKMGWGATTAIALCIAALKARQ